MKILTRFKRPARLPNIAVYGITAIVDGNVKASPLGFMPRPPAEFEKRVKEQHRLSGSAFLNEQLHGSSVILRWHDEKIEAVCFVSCDDARGCPGFTPFPDNQLDSVLTHFPR